MHVARQFNWRRLWLGIGIVSALAGAPDRAAAHNPAMSLNPSTGPIGTLVTVSVTGFDPDREAEVFWNQEDIGAFHIGPDGSGAMSFSVPGTASPGSYQVLVLCMTCQPPIGERADAWFEVSASDPTPTPTGFIPTATPTTNPPTPLLTVTPPATATLTCEQVGHCTSTPTPTSLPTATLTGTPVMAPSSLPSVTAPLPSPTPVATQTACLTAATCTATPTRATPRPSATVSATPTRSLTPVPLASRSPTPVVGPSQTRLPVHSTATITPTSTATPPRPAPSLPVESAVIGSPTPAASVRGSESALVILTILLGGLVMVLGGLLSGLIRWPFGRGR